jgi:peptide/nickel transport system permease protein
VRYLLGRFAGGVGVVLVTLLASFALFMVAPTDPAGAICGQRACPPERIEEITRSLKLDRPVLEQFGAYMAGVVAGRTIHSGGTTVDCPAPCLGYSYINGQPVTRLLAQAVPVTVSIVVGSALVYLALGVLLGAAAARRHGSWADRSLVATAQVVGAVPYFVVALLVALYVTVLPPAGYTSPLVDPGAWAAGLLAAWLTIGLTNATAYARHTRASMVESLREDYIRTARAKGVSERRVVYRHGLRAAFTPVATVLGLDLALQLTGAVFTESIFGLPGLGQLTLRAFDQYDLPVLMGCVLIGAVVLVALNLCVDVAYRFLDPRVTG